jgi:hypothetical protein
MTVKKAIRSASRASAMKCGAYGVQGAISALLIIALTGCAALAIGEPTPRQRAMDLEPMLSAAGFHMIPADTPEKLQHLKSLPALKVNYYVGKDGAIRYWFADPDYCHCLYLGDEAAYQKYENLRVHARIAENEQEAAEENYEAQQQMEMNMMDPFGFGFGPGIGFGF